MASAPSVKRRHIHTVSALGLALTCELKFQTSISIIEINSFQNAFIFLRPFADECYGLRELRAHWCQRVVDVWRHYRVNKAIKKSATFQFSQGLGQHLPGNVGDGTLEFVDAI